MSRGYSRPALLPEEYGFLSLFFRCSSVFFSIFQYFLLFLNILAPLLEPRTMSFGGRRRSIELVQIVMGGLHILRFQHINVLSIH